MATVTFHKLSSARTVLLTDELLLQLKESFSVHKNKGAALSTGDGGASGSFFFFSHDRKFLLKTMTEDELKLYVENIDRFTAHFKSKPYSLLAKIYGVLSFKIKY